MAAQRVELLLAPSQPQALKSLDFLPRPPQALCDRNKGSGVLVKMIDFFLFMKDFSPMVVSQTKITKGMKRRKKLYTGNHKTAGNTPAAVCTFLVWT